MNQVILRGRLTTNPVIRYSKDGSPVASFSIAVPDRMAQKDRDGNFPVDFIKCCAFGKEAEVLESYAIQGTEILITMGKLKSVSYMKDDIKIFTTECQIIHFEFVSGTKQKTDEQTDNKNKTKK